MALSPRCCGWGCGARGNECAWAMEREWRDMHHSPYSMYNTIDENTSQATKVNPRVIYEEKLYIKQKYWQILSLFFGIKSFSAPENVAKSMVITSIKTNDADAATPCRIGTLRKCDCR